MKKNCWKTASSFCCPECGHLYFDSADACRFCDRPPTHHRSDLKTLDRIESGIMFDDEKCFFEINLDDGF